MKKRILMLLCFGVIGFSVICTGQNQNKIDSLLAVLKNSKEDTNKVKILVKLAHVSLNSNPVSTLNFSKESLSLSEKLKFEKGREQSLNNIGSYYYSISEYDSAISFFRMALEVAEKINDKKEMTNYLGNIGTMYSSKGDFEKSSEYKLKALKISEELKDTAKLSVLSRNIGVDYANKGDYATALGYYFKSLKLSEAIKDSLGLGSANLCIGEVYTHEKEYDKALSHHFESLKICIARNDIRNVATNYYDIANTYQGKGKNDEALEYYKKSIEQCEKINLIMILASCYDGIASVYLKMDKTDSLLVYYSKALKIFEDTDEKLRIAELHQNMGEAYSKMRNYAQAIINFNAALEIAHKIGAKDVSNKCYQSLSEVYNITKNYKMAYDNHVLFMQMNDSINNVESKNKIAEIEGKYNTEKKEKEIALLTSDKAIQNIEIKKQKLQKYSFIGGLGLIIILLLLGYRVYRTRQILRLQSIRNKISGDLHDDIGSTLNSISIYSEVAKKKDSQQDEALEMIGDASRKIIEAMSDIVWTINPENDSFAKIIFRMKSLAYNLFRAKKIEFTFHADEILNEKKLSIEERRNFYLIFKEAINNLVKYSNATRAAITLTNENDYIKLRIQDDGVGFDISQDMEGNGLKSMKRRADEMNAQFKIESQKENGTQIELILKA